MSWSVPLAMGVAGGLAGMFGSPDYMGAAQNYQNSLNQLAQGWQPYERRGVGAEYGTLGLDAYQMLRPQGQENRIASTFQNSPYQQQLLNNTANMMNYNAANTGMLGSTAQDAALQNQMAGMENQWQQQYINRAIQHSNMANQYLQGMARLMAGQGFNAKQIDDQLQAQGDMAVLEAALQPSSMQQGLIGAASGFMGGMNDLYKKP